MNKISEQQAEAILDIEPDYVKIYLPGMPLLKAMSRRQNAVLMSLLKRASYTSDGYDVCIVLAPAIKADICEELGYRNQQSLGNALRALVKGNILHRIGRGMYRFNPCVFGRATRED